MKKNLWIFLAVPVLLILAIGIAVFISQPKVQNVTGTEYVDINGDEYLADEYITPDEEGIGDLVNTPELDYFVPVKLEDCEKRPQGELRDTCYLLYTSLNSDPDGCQSVKDSSIRNDCFTRAAFLTGDASFCDNVKTGYSQCVTDVALKTLDSSLCEKADYEKEQCFAAFRAKDPALCAQSVDRSACIFAIQDNNSGKCNEIQTYKSFCYNYIATESNNFALCEKAETSRNSCVFRVALNTNNPVICEYLTETRDSCVAWIAYNTQNRELCLQAGSQAQSCMEDLS